MLLFIFVLFKLFLECMCKDDILVILLFVWFFIFGLSVEKVIDLEIELWLVWFLFDIVLFICGICLLGVLVVCLWKGFNLILLDICILLIECLLIDFNGDLMWLILDIVFCFMFNVLKVEFFLLKVVIEKFFLL